MTVPLKQSLACLDAVSKHVSNINYMSLELLIISLYVKFDVFSLYSSEFTV